MEFHGYLYRHFNARDVLRFIVFIRVRSTAGTRGPAIDSQGRQTPLAFPRDWDSLLWRSRAASSRIECASRIPDGIIAISMHEYAYSTWVNFIFFFSFSALSCLRLGSPDLIDVSREYCVKLRDARRNFGRRGRCSDIGLKFSIIFNDCVNYDSTRIILNSLFLSLVSSLPFVIANHRTSFVIAVVLSFSRISFCIRNYM